MKTLSLFCKIVGAALLAISIFLFATQPAAAEEPPGIGVVVHIGPMQGGTICDTLNQAVESIDTPVGERLPEGCGGLAGVVIGRATVVAYVEHDDGTRTAICRYDFPGAPWPVQFGPWRTFEAPGQAT